MRRIILFTMVLMVVFITGCDNKTIGNVKRLSCNIKVQTVDVDIYVDFDEKELVYLGLKYEMDLSTFTNEQIELLKKQDMCSVVKQSMSSYTDTFTNCKQKMENKNLIITADLGLDKLVSGNINNEANIEDVKATLEKQNYTCTINNK